jgi:hypothetical protein
LTHYEITLQRFKQPNPLLVNNCFKTNKAECKQTGSDSLGDQCSLPSSWETIRNKLRQIAACRRSQPYHHSSAVHASCPLSTGSFQEQRQEVARNLIPAWKSSSHLMLHSIHRPQQQSVTSDELLNPAVLGASLTRDSGVIDVDLCLLQLLLQVFSSSPTSGSWHNAHYPHSKVLATDGQR